MIIVKPLSWLSLHRVQLGLSLRVTVAVILSLAAAQFLGLALPLWAVLTAIVVTQMSVGRSLKATIDYLSGTVGGAIFGTLMAVLIPHRSEIGILGLIATAVAPLSLIAAFLPNFTIAPATAVIVILLPLLTHSTSLMSALDRVSEVALGGAIGLVVSFLILPSNAHRLAIETAARTLEQMALAFNALFKGLETGLDIPDLHKIQDGIGQALGKLDTIIGEAERERAVRFGRQPAMRSLMTCLMRLRHDLVMIGRVAVVPLPELFRPRLRKPLAAIETEIVAYLEASAIAILAHRAVPALGDLEAALAAYEAEVAALRAERLTLALSAEDAERFFALGFVLEQMRRNFEELAERAGEWAVNVPG